jgi:hypothetical protein
VSAAPRLSPRAPAVASVEAAASVAVSLRTTAMPQALTAADRLMQLARILRFGASGLFLEVEQIQRRRPEEAASGRSADIALLALGMHEAAQELDRQAADADLQAYLACDCRSPAGAASARGERCWSAGPRSSCGRPPLPEGGLVCRCPCTSSALPFSSAMIVTRGS